MPRKKISKKEHQRCSLIQKKPELAKSDIDDSLLSFSFAHLDTSQGQDFEDLLKNKLVKAFFERLRQYSKLTFNEAKSKKFKDYPNFPTPDETDFKHPSHVPQDAVWVSFHLKGKSCVIAHLIKNTLFIVFIDCDHKFWKSKQKNT